MISAPPLDANMSAAEACERLVDAGWRQVGAGDWSWVFADASDASALRATPFDPGYRMFADECRSRPVNRWLPRVEQILPLARDGYAVLMERLWPANEADASAFCAALGIANETGYPPPTAGVAVASDEPEVAALRARIDALLASAKARYRRWAVCDIREGNVMADRSGRLKLVDPVGVGGWMIVDALRNGRTTEVLATFSIQQLVDFLSIPYFGLGREGLAERDELLALVSVIGQTPNASLISPASASGVATEVSSSRS